MNNLTKEQFEQILNEERDAFFVLCAGGGILKNQDCAGYIATSENSAREFFNTILNDLPENMKEFSTVKITNDRDIYSFCGLFNRPTFKYINLINYGIIPKDIFIRKNMENVKNIYEKLKNFKDNDLIYSVYKKDHNAFSITDKFKQFFFSNITETKEFIAKYNNDELGLFYSAFEIDDIANGCIHDMLNCCFDGKDCSGWDIVESVYRIFNKNYLNEETMEEILKNKELFVAIETEESNKVITKKNNAIFFTSENQVDKFIKKNKNHMPKEYQIIKANEDIYKRLNELISNSIMVYIDDEKHILPINFLIAAGLRKKMKHWNSIEEVEQKAKSIWNKDRLYIILSIKNANLENNTSIPYVVNTSPLCLWIFEDYECAKQFIDKNGKEKPNGKYPIGVIDNSKILWSLKTTLSIANALNISDVEFNPEEYECIHFKIQELFRFNGENLPTQFSGISQASDSVENIQLKFNNFSYDKNY